jgi:hypothetical protein
VTLMDEREAERAQLVIRSLESLASSPWPKVGCGGFTKIRREPSPGGGERVSCQSRGKEKEEKPVAAQRMLGMC